VALQLLILTL